MKKSFSLAIALPAQHLIFFEAKQVIFPAIDGYMGFMAGRKPLIAALGPGLIRIVDISDQHHWFGTTGGFCEMVNNEAVFLCDSIIRSQDTEKIDLDPSKPLFIPDHSNMSEKQKIELVTKMLARQLFKIQQQQE